MFVATSQEVLKIAITLTSSRHILVYKRIQQDEVQKIAITLTSSRHILVYKRIQQDESGVRRQ